MHFGTVIDLNRDLGLGLNLDLDLNVSLNRNCQQLLTRNLTPIVILVPTLPLPLYTRGGVYDMLGLEASPNPTPTPTPNSYPYP